MYPKTQYRVRINRLIYPKQYFRVHTFKRNLNSFLKSNKNILIKTILVLNKKRYICSV